MLQFLAEATEPVSAANAFNAGLSTGATGAGLILADLMRMKLAEQVCRGGMKRSLSSTYRISKIGRVLLRAVKRREDLSKCQG